MELSVAGSSQTAGITMGESSAIRLRSKMESGRRDFSSVVNEHCGRLRSDLMAHADRYLVKVPFNMPARASS